MAKPREWTTCAVVKMITDQKVEEVEKCVGVRY